MRSILQLSEREREKRTDTIASNDDSTCARSLVILRLSSLWEKKWIRHPRLGEDELEKRRLQALSRAWLAVKRRDAMDQMRIQNIELQRIYDPRKTHRET